MKKLFALIFTMLGLFMFCRTAYCSNGVSFELEYSGDELRKNWGFDIYFNAKSDTQVNISAIRLDIYYDNAELKFLSAKTYAEADIDAYEIEGGTVRIVWINSSGQSASKEGERLFTLRFKPLTSTDGVSYDFSSNILETISYDAEYLSVENSPYISISKSGSYNSGPVSSESHTESSENGSSSEIEESSSKMKRKDSSEETGSENESSAPKETDETEEEETGSDISIGDRKTINSENGFTYLMLGAGGTLFIIAAVFFVYMFGKKHGGK